MDNLNMTYLDDIDIPVIIDDDYDYFFNLNDNINANPLNSNGSIDTNKIHETNHISILNSSSFNISFEVIYTLGTKNMALDSGEFLPSYTMQIPFQKEATFIYLIINSIDSSKNESIIYSSSLNLNKNYKFTITGNLINPIISEN